MNYQRIYILLIERAKNRQLTGYSEKHHIFPKCLGGNNSPSNIVHLLPREHFVAHQLLVKIHPDSHGLAVAAFFMAGKSKKLSGGSRQYEWLRENFAKIHSLKMKKKPQKKTQARLDHIASRIGVPLTEAHRKKVSEALKGKKRSPEAIQRISAAARNKKPASLETRRKISEFLKGNSFRKGIPNTPELKEKIRAAHVGRKQSQEEKDKRARSRRTISDEKIMAIKADALIGGFTCAQIATRNGSSSSQVSRILTGKMYSSVVIGI